MFSAKSRGLIATHFTRTGFQLDEINCEWIFRCRDGGIGLLPDGTAIHIYDFEDHLLIGFTPKEKFKEEETEAIRYLWRHRKLVRPGLE